MSAASSTRVARKCQVDGCERKHKGHGFCHAHLRAVSEGRTLSIRHRRKASDPPKICAFPDCGRLARDVGFCDGHSQQKRGGKELRPLHETKRPNGTPPRIEYDEIECPVPGLSGPCRIFRGAKNHKGYGLVGVNGRQNTTVHRYVWQRDVGPIPSGMMIDHQCRNRACCNVNHLRVVTPKVNAIENSVGPTAANSAKTHCLRGHEFTDENTYRQPGMTGRLCRTCKREDNRRRKKAASRCRITDEKASLPPFARLGDSETP